MTYTTPLPRISVARAARGFILASVVLPFLWAGMVLSGMNENSATVALFAITLIAGIVHFRYLIRAGEGRTTTASEARSTLPSLMAKLRTAEQTSGRETVSVSLERNEIHLIERIIESIREFELDVDTSQN